jgi:hypothetical protein
MSKMTNINEEQKKENFFKRLKEREHKVIRDVKKDRSRTEKRLINKHRADKTLRRSLKAATGVYALYAMFAVAIAVLSIFGGFIMGGSSIGVNNMTVNSYLNDKLYYGDTNTSLALQTRFEETSKEIYVDPGNQVEMIMDALKADAIGVATDLVNELSNAGSYACLGTDLTTAQSK